MGDGPCHLNMFNHHDRYQPASCPCHPVTLSPCHPVTIYRRINSPLVLKKFVARLAFHPSNDCLYLTYNQPGYMVRTLYFNQFFVLVMDCNGFCLIKDDSRRDIASSVKINIALNLNWNFRLDTQTKKMTLLRINKPDVAVV